jgi:hypothetical protein
MTRVTHRPARTDCVAVKTPAHPASHAQEGEQPTPDESKG